MHANNLVAVAGVLTLAAAWPGRTVAEGAPGAAAAPAPATTAAEPTPAAPAAPAPVAVTPVPPASNAQATVPPPPAVRMATRLAAPTELPILLSGYFWTDTGYLSRTNRVPGEYDQKSYYMQGRGVLGATYERRLGNLFGLARLELLALVNEYANSRYEPHVQDAYVMLGQRRWDVQLGRFLAWEVYYRGQGIELYTAEEAGAADGPRLYLLDYTRGYMNGPGQAALHLYPFDALGVEVSGVYGQDNSQNYLGVRPVADLKLGPLELVGGYEYLKKSPQQSVDKVESTAHGFAGRAQLRLGPVTVGVDASHAKVDVKDINGLVDATNTVKGKTSLGGWADLDVRAASLGLGFHRTTQENGKGENDDQYQAFVSCLYRLPIEGLTVKAVFGFARAHHENSDANGAWNNDMRSVRVRVGYDFI